MTQKINNAKHGDKLGFVMMLDVSDSMRDALPLVKIDSKAFVRCARPGDQFGINAFSDEAFWVYPEVPHDPKATPNIATVSGQAIETLAAALKIEELKTYNMTNMGKAIELSNNLITQATTPLKAFVLLSDGYHNRGRDPAEVLQNTPPIYIAGLQILDRSYFNRLVAKNEKSRLFIAPNAFEMGVIFNYILADSNEANLALNEKDIYARGSDYMIKEFTVSEDGGLSQLNVVWSDKKYKYTSGMPSGNNINIILVDPDDRSTDKKPDIVDDGGYCIYNLQDAKPGVWHVVIQYCAEDTLLGTCGGIEFDPSVFSNFEFPSTINLGESFGAKVNVSHENNPLEQMNVRAKISSPLHSVDEVIERHKNDLKGVNIENSDCDDIYARLRKLRDSKLRDHGVDIFPRKHSLHSLKIDKDGVYGLNWNEALVKGVYDMSVEINGIIPKTNRKYKSLKRGAFVVN
jgi:hypothetical protein